LRSDVGPHAQAPTFGDEAPRVITLVGTERDATLGARIMSLYHGECGLALGPARCPRRVGLDDQALAGLCKWVADEAELCRHARTLAIEFGVRIGGARMRGVATLFPMKAALAIAAWTRRLVGAVLGPEALQARPRLDERTVDREMVARQQRPHLAWSKDGGHELRRPLGIEQPVSVLREDGRVPDGIVDAEPDEPAEHQVVVELLHQLAFGAHREERLQQRGAKQPLRRDRGAAFRRVEPGEFAIERGQR